MTQLAATNPNHATALAERFAQVITAFLPVIGLFQRWFQPYALTVYNRFARARRRLASVMARYAAGKLHRRASGAATRATAGLLRPAKAPPPSVPPSPAHPPRPAPR